MEIDILKKIFEKNKEGIVGVLVTLIEAKGSVPRKAGTMMAIFEDEVYGTIGGGMLEFRVIEKARECIRRGENLEFQFSLQREAELGMTCGGEVRGFIKCFFPPEKIIILGYGHIGKNLSKLLENSNFEVEVFDDREEFLEENVIVGDYKKLISEVRDSENNYYVIVTKGHKSDEEVLRKILLEKKYKYIGLVGSKKKVIELLKKIKSENIKMDETKIFSPIGLDFSDGTPYEIAVEILAEILAIKNKKNAKHRRIDVNSL